MDDVLERWDRWYDSDREDLETAMDLGQALAAEVRELRKDRERSEKLWDTLMGGPYFVVNIDAADALNRENIERHRGMGIVRLLDAALSSRGEDAGA